MIWKVYPESIPTEDGYYMTRYYSPTNKCLLYKALWFSVEENLWAGPWPWSYTRIPSGRILEDGTEPYFIKHLGIDVREYQPASRADYYTQCDFVTE